MDQILKNPNIKRATAYFAIISILITGIFVAPIEAQAEGLTSTLPPHYVPVAAALIVAGYQFNDPAIVGAVVKDTYNKLPSSVRTSLLEAYPDYKSTVTISETAMQQVKTAIEGTDIPNNLLSEDPNELYQFTFNSGHKMLVNRPLVRSGSNRVGLSQYTSTANYFHYYEINIGDSVHLGGNYYLELVPSSTTEGASRLCFLEKSGETVVGTYVVNSSLHYHSYGYPYKYSIYASFYISSPYEDRLYFESYVVTESGNYAATPGSGSLESAPRQRFFADFDNGVLGSRSVPDVLTYSEAIIPSGNLVIDVPTDGSVIHFVGMSSQDALDGKLVSGDKNLKTLVLSAGYAAAFYQYRPDDGSFDYASLVLWSENNSVRRRQIPGIEDNYYDHGLRYSVVDGWPTEGPVDVLNENPILMKNFYDNWGYITNTRGSYLHMGLGLNKSLVVYNTFIYWGDAQTPYRNNELLIRYNASAYKVKVYSITTKDNDGLFPDGIEYSQYQPYDPYPDLPNADDEPVNLIDIDDPRWIDNTDFDYVMPDPNDPGSPPSSIDYNPPPTGGSIGGLDPGSIYKDEDLNLIGSVKKLVNDFKQMIIDLFVAPVGAIKSMISSGTAFMGVVKDMFSWLPGDITTVIFSGLTLMVVIGVLKMLL